MICPHFVQFGSDYSLRPSKHTFNSSVQLIGYDKDVYLYFKEQEHLCGYDLHLTYSQNGHFPTFYVARSSGIASGLQAKLKSLLNKEFSLGDLWYMVPRLAKTLPRKRSAVQNQWKRDLRGRANGTIDSRYGCFLCYQLLFPLESVLFYILLILS